MRRIFKILSISFLVFFVWLLAFAFYEPFQNWNKAVFGPPFAKFFGGTYTMITTSPFWMTYIAPTLNAFLIGMLFMIPIAWVWHRSIYNKFRGMAHRSVVSESGPQIGVAPMGKPISQQTTPTPTPVATQEASPTPAPAPTPKPETETAA